jgi:Uma2 family endonuclease
MTWRNMPLPEPEDEVLYEIVNGQWVKKPGESAYGNIVACQLATALHQFAQRHEWGEAVCQLLFHLGLNSDCCRRPAVAFVSFARWAKGRAIPERDNAWDVVPDLAVEVVSPNDLSEDVLGKIEEYFQAGVQLVWVVYPQRRIIHVYESFTRIRVLTRNDELDGGAVLPGFRLPLTALFEEEPSAG